MPQKKEVLTIIWIDLKHHVAAVAENNQEVFLLINTVIASIMGSRYNKRGKPFGLSFLLIVPLRMPNLWPSVKRFPNGRVVFETLFGLVSYVSITKGEPEKDIVVDYADTHTEIPMTGSSKVIAGGAFAAVCTALIGVIVTKKRAQ